MFKNYLKVAVRNLLKYKVYSSINIGGLAIGIACCILIFLFVRSELTYDQFHENADRIYRVYKFQHRGNTEIKQAFLPPPLAPILAEEFPEIERVVRLFLPFNEATKLIHYNDNWFKEKIYFADPGIFNIFTFPLLKGNPATALQDPNAVVLSEEIAEKFFGLEDPLGKYISIRVGGKDQDFVVSGIVKSIPGNSSIKFDILLNYQKVKDELEGFFGKEVLISWNNFTEIFVQLSDQSKISDLESQFPSIVDKYMRGQIQLHLQAMNDIHLDPTVRSSITSTSNPAYSYILSGIALLLLFLAYANFITLSIGRSVSRAREVGMRKVLGAVRKQLMKQFLGEAFLMSFFSVLIGIALAEFFLSTFNNFSGKSLAIDYFANWSTLLILLGLMSITGFLGGSYPAVFLARFHPIEVLQNKVNIKSKNWFTQALVVFQFFLSITFIIGTLIMFEQLDYLGTKNLGFTKEQIVVIPTHTQDQEGASLLEIYKNELSQYNNVISVSGSDGSFARSALSLRIHSDKNFKAISYRVDYDYLETLGIELIEGRNFSEDITTDLENAVIINEEMVKRLEWDSAIGRELPVGFPSNTVIGVVKDYHFEPLHQKIEPLFLHIHPGRPISYILVRINPTNIPETLKLLENKWKEISGNNPFAYFFLDADVDRYYKTEERWGKIVSYSSLLAIFISCLGLFGLTALTITQRVKEIGIRKVFGASVLSIILLLSKEFVKLVLAANVIAWPIAYYAANQWLQDFAYRIDMGSAAFLTAGILVLFIAMTTISFQAIRAALANPVKTLRYE